MIHQYFHRSSFKSIHPPSLNEEIVKPVLTTVARSKVFPATNRERGLISTRQDRCNRKDLKAIGGKSIWILKGDGVKLDSMLFNVNEFRKRLDKMNSKTTSQLSEEEARLLRIQMIPWIELGIMLEHQDGGEIAYFINSQYEMKEERIQGQNEHATLILCPGWVVQFSVYKPLIARALMNGLNVVVYNPTGHGRSTGDPSEMAFKSDAEAVYAAVRREVSREGRVVVYASCAGAIAGIALASAHPGTDLIIDRSFDRFPNVAVNFLAEDPEQPSLKEKIVQKIAGVGLSMIITSSNAEALRQVKGNILIVTAAEDNFVPRSEQQALLDALPTQNGYITQEMITDYGHEGNWLSDKEALETFEGFLAVSGLSDITKERDKESNPSQRRVKEDIPIMVTAEDDLVLLLEQQAPQAVLFKQKHCIMQEIITNYKREWSGLLDPKVLERFEALLTSSRLADWMSSERIQAEIAKGGAG